MEISFNYSVTHVNEENKTMGVLYICDGCDNLTVDIPIPTSNTSLEDHIRDYAPYEYWALHFNETQSVEVGYTGIKQHTVLGGRAVMVYTYEILSVDSSGKSMLVAYKSEGYEDMTVGVRAPFTDETLEQVIEMYAPINNWLETTKNYVVPTVGISGSMQANIDIYNSESDPVPDGVQEAEAEAEEIITVSAITNL